MRRRINKKLAKQWTINYAVLENRMVLDAAGFTDAIISFAPNSDATESTMADTGLVKFDSPIICYEFPSTDNDLQFDDQGRVILQDSTFDRDGDGIGDYRSITHYEYNEDGSIQRNILEEDLGADGTIDSRRTFEYEYTDTGLMLSTLDTLDSNADGQTDSQTRMTNRYDEQGQMTGYLIETDLDGDGTIDETVDETFDPGPGNGDGSYSVDVDGDGIFDETYTISTFTDDNGVVHHLTVVTSFADPELVLSRTLVRYLQDDQGNWLFQSTETDVDGDGVYDDKTLVTWNYDDQGRITLAVTEVDLDGDGVWDSRSNVRYDYLDEYGSFTETTENDSNADGVIDYSESWTYTINSEGILTSRVHDVDSDGDGIIDIHEEFDDTMPNEDEPPSGGSGGIEPELQYDDQGRLIGAINYYDMDGDGNTDSIETLSWTYRDDGQVDTFMIESDTNADGIVDSRTTTTEEYDSDSQWIATHSAVDVDADGVIDYEETIDASTYYYASSGNLENTPADLEPETKSADDDNELGPAFDLGSDDLDSLSREVSSLGPDQGQANGDTNFIFVDSGSKSSTEKEMNAAQKVQPAIASPVSELRLAGSDTIRTNKKTVSERADQAERGESEVEVVDSVFAKLAKTNFSL